MGYLQANEYFSRLSELIDQVEVTRGDGGRISLDDGMSQAVEMVRELPQGNAKAMLIGNGGSAAIVSHMQNDLCKAVGSRAIVFNEPPLLTALANDHGYPCVFKRAAELWADNGDLMVAVSSSGASESIILGVREARERGCRVITFSGFQPDNPLRPLGDLNFYVASDYYGFVELAHGALTHCLTDSTLELTEEADAGE